MKVHIAIPKALAVSLKLPGSPELWSDSDHHHAEATARERNLEALCAGGPWVSVDIGHIIGRDVGDQVGEVAALTQERDRLQGELDAKLEVIAAFDEHVVRPLAVSLGEDVDALTFEKVAELAGRVLEISERHRDERLRLGAQVTRLQNTVRPSDSKELDDLRLRLNAVTEERDRFKREYEALTKGSIMPAYSTLQRETQEWRVLMREAAGETEEALKIGGEDQWTPESASDYFGKIVVEHEQLVKQRDELYAVLKRRDEVLEDKQVILCRLEEEREKWLADNNLLHAAINKRDKDLEEVRSKLADAERNHEGCARAATEAADRVWVVAKSARDERDDLSRRCAKLLIDRDAWKQRHDEQRSGHQNSVAALHRWIHFSNWLYQHLPEEAPVFDDDGVLRIKHLLGAEFEELSEWRKLGERVAGVEGPSPKQALDAYVTRLESAEKRVSDLESAGTRQRVRDGYVELALILDAMLERAQGGKGRERHADDNPWREQPIVTELRRLGGIQSAVYQVRKKALEALRLAPELAMLELLDVGVYAAAAVFHLDATMAEDQVAGSEGSASDAGQAHKVARRRRAILHQQGWRPGARVCYSTDPTAFGSQGTVVDVQVDPAVPGDGVSVLVLWDGWKFNEAWPMRRLRLVKADAEVRAVSSEGADADQAHKARVAARRRLRDAGWVEGAEVWGVGPTGSVITDRTGHIHALVCRIQEEPLIRVVWTDKSTGTYPTSQLWLAKADAEVAP